MNTNELRVGRIALTVMFALVVGLGAVGLGQAQEPSLQQVTVPDAPVVALSPTKVISPTVAILLRRL